MQLLPAKKKKKRKKKIVQVAFSSRIPLPNKSRSPRSAIERTHPAHLNLILKFISTWAHAGTGLSKGNSATSEKARKGCKRCPVPQDLKDRLLGLFSPFSLSSRPHSAFHAPHFLLSLREQTARTFSPQTKQSRGVADRARLRR